MDLDLLSWDEQQDGDLTEANMRKKLESLGYECTKYIYPPGTYFPPHTHGVDKIDGVLSGEFRLSMLGQSIVLREGDCLVVPKGASHSAEVVGSRNVVSIDAVKIE